MLIYFFITVQTEKPTNPEHPNPSATPRPNAFTVVSSMAFSGFIHLIHFPGSKGNKEARGAIYRV